MASCVSAKVPNYDKKKPLILDIWLELQGTNLKQDEVDALTFIGFRVVARADVIDKDSLFYLEGPLAQQKEPITIAF